MCCLVEIGLLLLRQISLTQEIFLNGDSRNQTAAYDHTGTGSLWIESR